MTSDIYTAAVPLDNFVSYTNLWPALTDLILTGGSVSGTLPEALGSSGRWPNLQRLELSSNGCAHIDGPSNPHILSLCWHSNSMLLHERSGSQLHVCHVHLLPCRLCARRLGMRPPCE